MVGLGGTGELKPLLTDHTAQIYSGTWPTWPKYDDQTLESVSAVLKSGRWSISGPSAGEECKERLFSTTFAAYNGTPYCIPTSSGTSALILSLQALNIGPGQEVLIPGLTCVACVLAVMATGATPILVDVDASTMAISASDARSKITIKTAGIIIVHPYCNLAEIGQFLDLSKQFNLPIIEDCAQSHGVSYQGQKLGLLVSLVVLVSKTVKPCQPERGCRNNERTIACTEN
jgi:dTDP-4-amino-4,6-dideoxygalactose transaminase